LPSNLLSDSIFSLDSEALSPFERRPARAAPLEAAHRNIASESGIDHPRLGDLASNVLAVADAREFQRAGVPKGKPPQAAKRQPSCYVTSDRA